MQMKKLAKHLQGIIFFTFLAVGLMLFSGPPAAVAEIPELRIGIGVDADTLNPQEQTTSLFMVLCDLMYDNLFYQTPDGKMEPRLAEKFDVSKDGLTYTLHLRKGVKFSDGSPFNAQAVKLTFDRALNPKLRVPLRFSIVMIKDVSVVDEAQGSSQIFHRHDQGRVRCGRLYHQDPAQIPLRAFRPHPLHDHLRYHLPGGPEKTW
jgi:ABC-type transport system substrate-binding protein